MASGLSVPDQIRQLDDARKLVLGDVKFWGSVVKGILPMIGPNASLELRRWGADFLSEAFSTPALPNSEKETMQIYVLDTLVALVESERRDSHVLRSVIQTAASIYPLAMRWIINNGYDTTTWEKMTRIKQQLLQIWDTAPPSIAICCIKFAQRVVLAQTVTSGHESRYGGVLDVSLDKIPSNHQSLDQGTLEAEATGLMDRMLSILHESSDALVVDATLNCLSILVRTRPGISNRIVNSLLSFNPLARATPMTPRLRVMVKSMEKTTRMLMIHLSKRDPHNPMVPKMQHYVEGMMRSLAELLDDRGKKRALEAPHVEVSEAKRQRPEPLNITIPPFGPGPHSLSDVFSFIGNTGLRNFDVSQVPPNIVARITVNTLSRIDQHILDKAVQGIRDRLVTLANAPAPEINPNTAPLGVEEDDDDYEPDFSQAEDTEQILNKLDGASTSLVVPGDIGAELDLGSFSLPQPQQMTQGAALAAGNGVILRLLDMMKAVDEPTGKKQKVGFSRLAASSGNRDSWVTMLTRVATRSPCPLQLAEDEGGESASECLESKIRDMLYAYVMEDFRKHIDIAVSWLNEEWYNDRVRRKAGVLGPSHYEGCVLRLIDGFLPYLHAQDKVLTRFLSEIPELNENILARVKYMCRDPSVIQLALTSLLYLVMMRPPIKEMALDAVQDIWLDHDDARPMAGKWLTRHRPGFIEAQQTQIQDGNQKADGAPVQSAAIAT